MAATIGIVAGLGGSLASGAGSRKAAKQEKRIANFNAKVADAQAEDALLRGREAEDQLRLGVRKLIGSQRAGFAAQGIALDDGSALDVQTDTAVLGEQDAQRVRLNAAREAWGFRQDAYSFRLGGQNRAAQRQAEGYGTILGGLGNAFSQYAQTSSYRSR